MHRSLQPENRDAFTFWTQSEIVRVSILLALAAIPILAANADNGPPQPDSPTRLEPAHETTGGLRSVNVSNFEINTLKPSAFADRE